MFSGGGGSGGLPSLASLGDSLTKSGSSRDEILPSLGDLAKRGSSKPHQMLPSLGDLAKSGSSKDHFLPSLSDLAKKDSASPGDLNAKTTWSGCNQSFVQSPSLGDLAKEGSSKTTPTLRQPLQSFGSDFLKDVSLTDGGGVSLSTLAQAAEKTGLPSLFGHKSTAETAASKLIHKTTSQQTSLSQEIGHTIDLTAALRLTTPAARIEQAPKPSQPSPIWPAKILPKVELLIGSGVQSVKVVPAKPSAFGRVLCNRWALKRRKHLAKVMCKISQQSSEVRKEVKMFDFEQPSPDDVVRNAQGKVFRRPV